MNANTPPGILPALLLAAGLAAGGWFTGHGFMKARTADRTVTVKGIAEREARADIAIWPLRISAASDDLGRAQAQLEHSLGEINAFLLRHGLDPATATLQAFSVSDAKTNQYGNGPHEGSRFVIRLRQEGKVIRLLQQDRPVQLQALYHLDLKLDLARDIGGMAGNLAIALLGVHIAHVDAATRYLHRADQDRALAD